MYYGCLATTAALTRQPIAHEVAREWREAHGREARLQQREDPCLRLPEELGGTKNTFSRVGQPRITSPQHRPSRLDRRGAVPLQDPFACLVRAGHVQFPRMF